MSDLIFYFLVVWVGWGLSQWVGIGVLVIGFLMGWTTRRVMREGVLDADSTLHPYRANGKESHS